MKKEPFWTDDFSRPSDLLESPLPEKVDVAVIGGGFTGLNAARVLARSGASVAVLEQHTIGWGASSRNGGLATTGLKQSTSVIFRRYGPELGRLFWQSSLDAIDLIGEIVADEKLDCDFARKGHVYLASKPTHFRMMQERVNWFKETLAYPLATIRPGELRSEIGSDIFYGGLIDEYSGSVHPAKYVYGLARAVARHGAHLCEQVEVTDIKMQPKGFVLQSPQGDLTAREVVVATNGYTSLLVPKLKPRVFPVGSYIIVTEPLSPELQRSVSPNGRVFYDSKRFLNYFRLTPDGRMLFGGRNDLSTDLDLEESARRLRQRMVQVFPDLRDVAITHSWTGKLGITFDLMPHIGRVNGVHYAFGYGGHGVSIATYLGTEMGLLLAGQKRNSPFAEIPHQTRFFYRNRPWFLPLAATYYRLMDWLS